MRTLLVALTKKVTEVKELPDAQTVGNALYGFQRMSGEYMYPSPCHSVIPPSVILPF